MQTIESIRKTNELSKVLRQHGFAADTFEAMTQAQGIVDEPTTILESVPPKIREESAVQEPTNFDNKIASLERSKHLLSGRVDSLHKELQKTQENLKQVLLRLDGAESKLRSHVSSQAAPASQEVKQTMQAAPAQSAQATPAQDSIPSESQEKPMSETKRQQLDSSLSVENVFYSGVR